MIKFFNLVEFTNHKYKILKFIYDNQIKVKNDKYVVLSQQEIVDMTHFSKNKTNKIYKNLETMVLLIVLIIQKENIL